MAMDTRPLPQPGHPYRFTTIAHRDHVVMSPIASDRLDHLLAMLFVDQRPAALPARVEGDDCAGGAEPDRDAFPAFAVGGATTVVFAALFAALFPALFPALFAALFPALFPALWAVFLAVLRAASFGACGDGFESVPFPAARSDSCDRSLALGAMPLRLGVVLIEPAAGFDAIGVPADAPDVAGVGESERASAPGFRPSARLFLASARSRPASALARAIS